MQKIITIEPIIISWESFMENPSHIKILMPFVIAFSGRIFTVLWPIAGFFYLKQYFLNKK